MPKIQFDPTTKRLLDLTKRECFDFLFFPLVSFTPPLLLGDM